MTAPQGFAPGQPCADQTRERSVLETGANLGRYVVLGLVGEGGMGAVYAAYDPQLDRKVAIKVLHAHGGADAVHDPSLWQARLAREAKAMARLSHPNVMTIHDVDFAGEQIFIVMEFIDGDTLAQWIGKTRRPWRETLKVFSAAGRGLAAAHGTGMVHRDFKPENVLMGKDGRVVVTDFGLARASDEVDHHDLLPSEAAPTLGRVERPCLPSSDSSLPALTLKGTIIGTPEYMAPEQHLAEATDSRTDQFGFCVSLYWALYGQRPFADGSASQLLNAVVQGAVRPPPKQTDVPSWLRRVLLRGLRPSKQDRYPSMERLLEALGSDPAVKRRRFVAVAAVVGSAAVLGFGARHQSQQKVQACNDLAKELAGVWDAPRQAQVEGAFLATGKPYAADAFREARRTLDSYAAGWATERSEACLATRVRGEQSDQMMSLRVACLEDRLGELRALSDVLAQADGDVIKNAAQAAHGLTSLNGCRDIDALSSAARLPSDPAVREQIKSVRNELAAAKALSNAGKHGEALSRASSIVERARVLGYGPLEAEATLQLGVEQRSLDEKAALSTLPLAIRLAEQHRLDAAKARAQIWLGHLLGYSFGRFEEGHAWMNYSGAVIARLGGDKSLDFERHSLEGWIYLRESKAEAAVASFRRALEIARDSHDIDQFQIAQCHSGLSTELAELGRMDEAVSEGRLALDLGRLALGPSHPRLCTLLSNLALVEIAADQPEEALLHVELALAKTAERVRLKDLSADSPARAHMLDTKGQALLKLHRAEEALALFLQAHDIWEGAYGSKYPGLAASDEIIGRAQLALGRRDDAFRSFQKAFDPRNEVPGDPAVVARALAGMAELRMTQGAVADALRLAERAVSVPDVPPRPLAEARFVLAKAVAANGGGERAIGLARQASDTFVELKEAEEAARVAVWLSDRN